MNTLSKVLAIAAVCACAPSVAHAAVINFQFTIHVGEASGTVEDVVGRNVAPGDTVQGYLTLDLSVPDLDPNDSMARYVFSSGPSFIGLGTPTPLSTSFEVGVHDTAAGLGPDRFEVHGRFTASNDEYLHFGFVAPDGDLWSSDALPQAGIPASLLALFPNGFYLSAPHGTFSGKLTSFELAGTPQPPDPPNTVPEPASLLLLGTGLIGAVRLRRRVRS